VVCKLSIVIPEGGHAGAILDAASIPEPGDNLQLGPVTVKVLEVRELLPPRGDFRFVHVTGQIARQPDDTLALEAASVDERPPTAE
jgi:hypothetical protein